MQDTDPNSNGIIRYLCSNPNCNSVFSKPKIITYCLCPTCQALVSVTTTEGQLDTKEAPLTLEKITLIESVEQQETKNQDACQSNTELTEPESIRAQTAPKFMELNVEEKEQINTDSTETKKGQMNSTEQLETVQLDKKVEAPIETKSISASQACKYFFGYLSQRNKKEMIPNACVECIRSLDCILQNYDKSMEAIEEIKKWY